MYFVAFKNNVPVEMTQASDVVMDLLLTLKADTVKAFDNLEAMISFLQQNEKANSKQTAQQTAEAWMEKITSNTENFTNEICDSLSDSLTISSDLKKVFRKEFTEIVNEVKKQFAEAKKQFKNEK